MLLPMSSVAMGGVTAETRNVAYSRVAEEREVASQETRMPQRKDRAIHMHSIVFLCLHHALFDGQIKNLLLCFEI